MNEIEDEFDVAADWLERLDLWDEDERWAFLAWVSESESHLSAARKVWSVIDDRDLDRLMEQWSVPEAAYDRIGTSRADADDAAISSVPAPARRGWWRVAGIGASLAASIVAIVFAFSTPLTTSSERQVIASGVAITERRTLIEGSTLVLDGNSRISVSLSDDLRLVELEQGRAEFAVSPDPARPFEVRASGVVATAIGTSFAVERLEGEIVVSVTHGRVIVSSGGKSVSLAAAQAIRIAKGKVPGLPFALNLEAAGSGMFDAEAEPLSQVVERLRRNTSTTIELQPGLGDIRVSGRFRRDDAEGSLAVIAEVNGLSLQREPGTLRITRK